MKAILTRGVSSELDDIWRETRGDPRVRVAILDGPVDDGHPCFVGATLRPVVSGDKSRESTSAALAHGTSIASVIFGQDHSTIHGIAPDCTGLILPIFAENATLPVASTTQKVLAIAIRHALAAGASIVNISAGAPTSFDRGTAELEAAIEACESAQTLVVAAIGNSANPPLLAPSAIPSVLAVGAIDQWGDPVQLVRWRGVRQPNVILAPGERILVAESGGGSALVAGTSYAAAIVSGVAALLLSFQIKYRLMPDPLVVRAALRATARPVSRYAPAHAWRQLDVEAALAYVKRNSSSLGSSVKVPPKGSRSVGNPQKKVESVVLSGGVRPSGSALANVYGGVARSRFGTTEIVAPDGRAITIPDGCYSLPDGRPGMEIIPVDDDSPTPEGSHDVDARLRQEMGLRPGDALFALLGYIRPDEHALSFRQIPQTHKLRLGHQHLAAYIGNGATTNVFPTFRADDWRRQGRHYAWNVSGRPAHIYQVSLSGAHQAALNRTALIVDEILTHGGRAPTNSDSTHCRLAEINTILGFYRDWLLDEDYLNDVSWYTNCSNLTTTILNVALNLPHCLESFTELFGEEGALLWQRVNDRFVEITGRPIPSTEPRGFVPLWKLEGLRADQVRPLTVAQYFQFDAARSEHRLSSLQAPRPLPPGVAMAWRPETVADVVFGIVELYLDVSRAGGVNGALGMLAFMPSLVQVASVDQGEVDNLLRSVVTKYLLADAFGHTGDLASWIRQVSQQLYRWFGGDPEDWGLGRRRHPSTMAQVERYLEPVREQLPELLRQGETSADISTWLRCALAPDVERARNLVQSAATTSGMFSTPGIVQRIVAGRYPKNRFIDIRVVGTAMARSELEGSDQ